MIVFFDIGDNCTSAAHYQQSYSYSPERNGTRLLVCSIPGSRNVQTLNSALSFSAKVLVASSMAGLHSHAHVPGEEAGCSCALHSSGVAQSMQVCFSQSCMSKFMHC